jgi:hypothetical protein
MRRSTSHAIVMIGRPMAAGLDSFGSVAGSATDHEVWSARNARTSGYPVMAQASPSHRPGAVVCAVIESSSIDEAGRRTDDWSTARCCSVPEPESHAAGACAHCVAISGGRITRAPDVVRGPASSLHHKNSNQPGRLLPETGAAFESPARAGPAFKTAASLASTLLSGLLESVLSLCRRSTSKNYQGVV